MSDQFCPLPAHDDDRIEPGHGAGGTLMHRLIDRVFRTAFGADPAEPPHDGAILHLDRGRFAFTTDSFVVTPLEFPGGDIGALAAIGTLNDLAMCGAQPLHLSAGFVLEEGLDMALLRRIVASMAAAASAAGVRFVTGDTKVVERGKGDGIYINTAGIGLVPDGVAISPSRVTAGDAVLLSGDIGRHGIAVLAVREGLGFEGTIESDLACLVPTVRALIDAGVDLHCLRDPTRGGLASALVEIATADQMAVEINDAAVAVSEPVRGACALLGLDPWHVANEGRLVAFVPNRMAAQALAVLRAQPGGTQAAIIGRVTTGDTRGLVFARSLGGTRVIDMLSGEQLPRIC